MESTTTLQKGLNLVSVPLQLGDHSIETVLASIAGKYSHVTRYDAATGTWFSYSPQRPAHLNTLTELEYLKGYFITMLSSGTLSIDGYPVPDDYHLSPGWNLVGSPDLQEQTADEFFARRYVHFSDLIALTQATQPSTFTTTSTLSPGYGYWLNVTNPGIVVNWEDPLPKPDTLNHSGILSIPGPGLQYLLRATTPNPNVVECRFLIWWAMWDGAGHVYCPRDLEPGFNQPGAYELFCHENTPGIEFSCFVDFSTNTLIPLDTHLSLKAELIDDTGSSGAAYTLVHVDNIPPGAISNLRSYYENASATEDRIRLTWTAPAENGAAGWRASDYIIKMSEGTPIMTEQDFENAPEIATGTYPQDPGTTQTCFAGVFPKGGSVTYYFQIKTIDEVGNYSMSNVTTGSTTPYYNVSVDSIHHEYEGVTTHTFYLYDQVEVWGELTNHWDRPANAEVSLRVDHVVEQQKRVYLAPNETGKTVTFIWIASDPLGVNNPLVQIRATSQENLNQTSRYMTKFVPVYSVVNDATLEFYSPNNYPIPKEIGNETGDVFYVIIYARNMSPYTPYYNFSATLTTNAILIGTDTSSGSPILPESIGSHTVTWHPLENMPSWTWILDSGASGSEYDVTVHVGKDPRDRITISRTVRIE